MSAHHGSMEEIADRCLADNGMDILLQYASVSTVIFGYWVERMPAKPVQVLAAFGRAIAIFPACFEYVSTDFACGDRSTDRLRFAAYCLDTDHSPYLDSNNGDDDKTFQWLLACYRLITFSRPHFLKIVPTDVLRSLMHHVRHDVRYLAEKLLRLYLGSTDAASILQSVADPRKGSTLLPSATEDIDVHFLELHEHRRIRSAKSRVSRSALEPSDVQVPSCVVEIAGTFLPRFSIGEIKHLDLSKTPAIRRNFAAFSAALAVSSKILLQGPAGNGKTFMVEEVCRALGREQDIVRIHLGAQTDAKLLLGTYTASNKLGEFKWHPGTLTQAVIKGKILLIENLDHAPEEVLGILLPLIERNEITIDARTFFAAASFRIVATISTNSSVHFSACKLLGARLWSTISLEAIPENDLKDLISSMYPKLQNLIQLLLQTYVCASHLLSSSQSEMSFKNARFRHIGVRDLVKFCERICRYIGMHHLDDIVQKISQNFMDTIFCEALDCFGASLSTINAKNRLSEVIGSVLGMTPERREACLERHAPTVVETTTYLEIGRVRLEKVANAGFPREKKRNLAMTSHTLSLLEQISLTCDQNEPVLLTGETGTGKTTVVQYLAERLGHQLVVINMSQQVEAGDLLGGYKPIDTKTIALPILEKFEVLFNSSFSNTRNQDFVNQVRKSFRRSRWTRLISMIREALALADSKIHWTSGTHSVSEGERKTKKRRIDTNTLRNDWLELNESVNLFSTRVAQAARVMAFAFVEGPLVRAVRAGHWVLLDEINLASSDTLENISGLLQDNSSILLSERGDIKSLRPHKDFRLFACMNPATDVGKRDLPDSIRSRFTEIYVRPPGELFKDLVCIVESYIGPICLEDDRAIVDVASLYNRTLELVQENKLADAAEQKPHYSTRTLARALVYAADVTPIYGLRRALYEAFCMSYLTLLSRASELLLLPIIEEFTVSRIPNYRNVTRKIPKAPITGHWIQFKHFWIQAGPLMPDLDNDYILTDSVSKNLLNLVRAATTRRYPILLQGPTSSGKTSMIEFLAKRTGHQFVRINNHEHTDIEEYMGSYISNQEGQLVFQEGLLVEAVRRGYWLVLDELNLAPSDVLEALNRLLDDNRELLINETQEIVRPHPSFLLFATQNPAGLYGGRKHLSRAFRNRFLELHFDDIPISELETIISRRCSVAPSYCKKIVEVFKQLSIRRQSTRVFEQKNSFVTLRDLFRWANRPATGLYELAINGYLLLAERVRRPEDRSVVKALIEKIMKVDLNTVEDYDLSDMPEYIALQSRPSKAIVWNKSMRRLFKLVCLAFRNQEAVLLVGDTGCGKTTVCASVAEALNIDLQTLNAHQNTETADIIGSQRPRRDRAFIEADLSGKLHQFLRTNSDIPIDETIELPKLIENFGEFLASHAEATAERLSQEIKRLKIDIATARSLFQWVDGPLIKSMKAGHIFLLDEISLAEDAVLERLNSVLESGRSVVLAEKGPDDSHIVANETFQICATMNPGGDFGKRELSPALRNRFTEIWVPPITNDEDFTQILEMVLDRPRRALIPAILSFSRWFCTTYASSHLSATPSVRDLLAWGSFCNLPLMPANEALVQGAALVYIDALDWELYENKVKPRNGSARRRCVDQLSRISGIESSVYYYKRYEFVYMDKIFAIGPYSLSKSTKEECASRFHLQAPGTYSNATRVLRAMSLNKPILLEGSPGVGKTSLIMNLAALASKPLTRINFSDQTDLVDLFGSDVPAEEGQELSFSWRGAPFLAAMQAGGWVLLDEMNLASQSILEGLNACLDHRGEAYIPELGRSFNCHPEFRVFAAQNPFLQGGGRKGLPKSFLNRFTIVYCESLSSDDIRHICLSMFPSILAPLLDNLINLVLRIQKLLQTDKTIGSSGAPWDLNLRDLLRWLTILVDGSNARHPAYYADAILTQRFRATQDRAYVEHLIKECFQNSYEDRSSYWDMSFDRVQIGRTSIARKKNVDIDYGRFRPFRAGHQGAVEACLLCLKYAWPCILTGSAGSGKSTLVSSLACLTGRSIEVISVNSDTDAGDLLGGFQQTDIQSQIGLSLQKWLRPLLNSLETEYDHAADLIRVIDAIRAGHHNEDSARDIFDLAKRCTSVVSSVGPLLQDLEQLLNAENQARFQWVDGSLVRAVREGGWVLLDNANLCSPSVLDRLNSLLEPQGELTVTERILSDGQSMIVKPHPDFRLLITLDPAWGELSPAMRNRGLEIHLPLLDHDDGQYLLSASSSQVSWLGLSDVLDASVDSHESSLILALLDYVPTRTIAIPPQLHTINRQAGSRFDAYLAANALRPLQTHNAAFSLLGASLDPRNLVAPREYSPFASYWQTFLDVGLRIFDLNRLWQANTSTAFFDKRHINLVGEINILTTAITKLIGTIIKSLFSSFQEIPEHTAQVLSSLVDEVSFLIQCHGAYPIVEFIGFALRCIKSRFDMLELSQTTHSLSSLLSNSRFTSPRRTGHLLEKLWKALRLPAPRSINALRAVDHLTVFLVKLDSTNSCSPTNAQESISLKLDILGLLNDTIGRSTLPAQLEAGMSTALQLPEEPPDMSLVDSQVACVIRIVHVATMYDELKSYKSWQSTNSPRLRELCLMSSLSSTSTLALLHFARPSVVGSSFDYARFSGCLRAVLCTDLSSPLKVLQDSNDLPIQSFDEHLYPSDRALLIPQWYKLTQLSDDLKLAQFPGRLAGIRNLAQSACKQSTSVLLPERVTLARIAEYKIDLLMDLFASRDGSAGNSQFFDRDLDDDSKRVTVSVPDECPAFVRPLLRSAIQSLVQFDNSAEEKAESHLALAILGLARVSMLLYICEMPIDPAVDHKIRYEKNQWIHGLAIGRYQSQRVVHLRQMGGDKSPRLANLQARVHRAALDLEDVPLSAARPEISRLTELYSEFDYCVSNVEAGGMLDVLIRSIVARDNLASAQVANFYKTLSQVESRLNNFPGYQDLCHPVLENCALIRKGLQLLTKSNTSRSSTVADPSTQVRQTLAAAISSKSRDSPGSSLQSMTLQQVLLTLYITRFRFLVSNNHQEAFNDAHRTIYVMFQGWYVERHEKNKLDAAHSDIFRTNISASDSEDDDFSTLFPDYSDESVPISIHRASAATDLLEAIEVLHNILIRNTECQVPSVRKSTELYDLIRRSARSSDKSDDMFANYCNTVKLDGQALSCLSLISSALLQEHETRPIVDQAKITSGVYNFYSTPNISESQAVIGILQRGRTRILDLSDAWPENNVLIEIEQIITRTLALPWSVPLAKVLTTFEDLFTYLCQWQDVASTQYSIATFIDQVRCKIIDWRKLELSSWSQLFKTEEIALLESDTNIWFNIYEITVFTGQQGHILTTDYLHTTLDLLSQMMTKTCVGLFISRLRYLELITAYISLFKRDVTSIRLLVAALKNITTYFSQYRPAVEMFLLQERKVLEDEIQQVVRLASWKDTNIFALRDSAKRSHRVLYKIIHKYRRVLRGSVEAIIATEMNNVKVCETKTFAPESGTAGPLSFLAVSTYQKPWHAHLIPPRYERIEETVLRVQSVTEGLSTIENNELEILVKHTLHEMDSLKAETPTVLVATDISLVKHLKNRKRRLLSDTLKALKAVGLRYILRPDEYARQANRNVQFCNLATLPETYYTESLNCQLFRMIDLLEYVRSGRSNHSEDISSQEMRRATGLFESLFHNICEERRELAEFSAHLVRFRTIMRKVYRIVPGTTTSKLILNFDHVKHGKIIDRIRIDINTLVHLISLTETMHETFCKLASSGHRSITMESWWIDLCSKLLENKALFQSFGENCVTMTDSLHASRNFIVDIRLWISNLYLWQANHPEEAHTSEVLLNWLTHSYWNNSTDMLLDYDVPVEPSISDMSNFEAELQNFADMVLLAVQSISHCHQKRLSHSSRDQWYSKCSRDNRQLLRCASLVRVSESLDDLLENLQDIRAKELYAEHIQTVIAYYFPVLRAYEELCISVETGFANFHSSASRCALLLGRALSVIAREGFCSPALPDSQINSKLATESGTGLADGKGAQDITDELDDDEQLEDARENQPPQDHPADDSERTAKEVADGIDGELESIDLDSVKDNSDSGDDSESEDVEDEIGSVDDQDRTALDEKMWNGEPSGTNEKDGPDTNATDQDDSSTNLVDKLEHHDMIDHENPIGEQESANNSEVDDERHSEGSPDDVVESMELEKSDVLDDSVHPEQTDHQDDNHSADGSDYSIDSADSADSELMDQRNDMSETNSIQEPESHISASSRRASTISSDNYESGEPKKVEQPLLRDEEDQFHDLGDENGAGHGGPKLEPSGPTKEDMNIDEIQGDEPNSEQREANGSDPSAESRNTQYQGSDRGQNKTTDQMESSEGLPEAGNRELRALAEQIAEFRRVMHISDASANAENGSKESLPIEGTMLQHIDRDEFQHDALAMGPDLTSEAANASELTRELTKEVFPEVSPRQDTDLGSQEGPPEVYLNDLQPKSALEHLEPAFSNKVTETADDDNSCSNVDEEAIDLPVNKEAPIIKELNHMTYTDKWHYHQYRTREFATALCEQLRLILEPTLAAKMCGDYKTGKRLNMRRVIPYIASDFKKDKIWLRRKKPSKRQYQIMLAIDDSKSMAESHLVDLAFDTVAMVSTALSLLESGQISIVKFGEQTEVLQTFNQSHNDPGVSIFGNFSFQQIKTDVKLLLHQSLESFRAARAYNTTGSELWQLQFIVSDGICEDHEEIRRLLRQAHEERIMVVFLVIDSLHSKKAHSIMQMSQAKYVKDSNGHTNLVIQSYMEAFAFQNFLIIREINELPELLSSCLRQFFAATNE